MVFQKSYRLPKIFILRTSLHTSFQEYFQNEVTLRRNILCPKNGNHVSISVFDRVWHAGLRSFNIGGGLVQAIQAIYENSSSAVLLNCQLCEFFKITVSVRKGCLLSPILFNLFLEKIMQETIHDHHTSISAGGRPIRNLCLADDIDPMGGSNGELQDLTNRLVVSAMSAQKRA